MDLLIFSPLFTFLFMLETQETQVRSLCWEDPLEEGVGTHWSGLPCLSPGDFHDPGIESGSPALQADSLPPDKDLESPSSTRLEALVPSRAGFRGNRRVIGVQQTT